VDCSDELFIARLKGVNTVNYVNRRNYTRARVTTEIFSVVLSPPSVLYKTLWNYRQTDNQPYSCISKYRQISEIHLSLASLDRIIDI